MKLRRKNMIKKWILRPIKKAWDKYKEWLFKNND